jgi:uncharacterized membrane-anchored protein
MAGKDLTRNQVTNRIFKGIIAGVFGLGGVIVGSVLSFGLITTLGIIALIGGPAYAIWNYYSYKKKNG